MLQYDHAVRVRVCVCFIASSASTIIGSRINAQLKLKLKLDGDNILRAFWGKANERVPSDGESGGGELRRLLES